MTQTYGGSVITLAGAVNARDLGGIRTPDGRTVRRGRLYRSDHLDDCTSEDIALLRDRLGVQLVIDLRLRPRERAHPGDPLPVDSGIDVVNIPLANDLAVVQRLIRDPAVGMPGYYLHLIRGERTEVVEVLRLIARRCHEPVWFHCTSGKDRTGTVAALVLALLGADSEDIVADYAATVVDPVAVRAHMDRQGLDELLPSNAFRADAETMREFLARLIVEYGSAKQWAGAAGLEPAYIERLRTELLDPVIRT